MFRDRKDVWVKLSELWIDPNVPIYETKGVKFAILSDIHLGNGSSADDFANNEFALMKALDYYRENEFIVILLGDIEELWQFDLSAIKKRYEEHIYRKLRLFPQGHVIRVFGNHDYEWGGFVDPIYGNQAPIVAPEAVKLKGKNGNARVLLVHGHQGTIESDKFSWFSRFWVRVFSFVEPFAKSIGLYSNSTATKSQIAKDYERTLYQWAKEKDVILICGHTHRAIFASKSHAENLSNKIAKLEAENLMRNVTAAKRLDNTHKIHTLLDELDDEKSKGRLIEPTDPGKEPLPYYFNTGCGVFSDGLTAIEIGDEKIRLVKWNRDSSQNDLGYQIYNEDKLSL
jgi:UDP-2,3-diacylglucosamine pyrophosphatase LpxH